MSAGGGVRLLEAVPGLADGLEPGELAEARRLLVVPAYDFAPGELDLPALRSREEVAGHCWGIVIISGAVLNNVRITDRICTRLFGPGDLVLLDGPVSDTIPTHWGWMIKQRARIALLDDRTLTAGQRWPLILRLVHERAAQVGRHGLLNRAISQLPRVEDRLLAFFWMVADQRGNARADGIWLDLPLTHDELGQLVGARRPTVSLGLRKLSERGHLTVEDHGFLLAPDSVREFRSP
jgi:CRP-like cAMP-binding protein